MYTSARDEKDSQHPLCAPGLYVVGDFHAMTIAGYELTDEIGRGGMSVVYAATRVASAETDSRASAAVKVFNAPEGPHRAELARKFMQEAKLLAALDHPNLIKVFDSGTTDDGRPWLAMELVASATGDVSLASRLNASKPISPDDVSRIYSQLRAALAYCHAQGIVHGDVKAENVLIASDGTVKLSDFGIARILQPDTRRAIGVSTVTLEGNLGTPYVRAPECRNGEKATAAADVYSFGVILYKLVTGIWYEGSERLLRHARSFAPDWAPVLTRMLAADPARRFADATVLPDAPWVTERRRRRIREVGLVALLAATLGLATFGVYRALRARKPALQTQEPSQRVQEPTLPPQKTAVPAFKERPAVDVQGGERKLTDEEWARYFLGTNEYDYVEEATLTRTNRLVLTRPVMYGTLHLPDKNGSVEVESPPGYEGYIVLARHIDGDMFNQMHVQRKGTLRVRASNRAIRVSYRPFPRNPEP